MSDFKEAWKEHILPENMTSDGYNGMKTGFKAGWNARGEAMSEAMKRLEALKNKKILTLGPAIAEIQNNGEAVIYSRDPGVSSRGMTVWDLMQPGWTIEDPKPKRIPEVQEYCDRYGVEAVWNGDCWWWGECIGMIPNGKMVFKGDHGKCPGKNWPKWEGPEEESIHEPQKDGGKCD